MKETGPDAVPPPARCSFEDRIDDRFDPVPDPNLNSIPSVFARPRIEGIVSWTELMKHAETCGCSSIPQLNHTGELNETIWWRSRYVSSASKVAASSSVAKYPPSRPQRAAVIATRFRSWRTECSRSGLPRGPRKYFWATTFVASCDQNFGTSTFRCSKATSPLPLEITASRSSHSTSSYGWVPGRVKRLENRIPSRGDGVGVSPSVTSPVTGIERSSFGDRGSRRSIGKSLLGSSDEARL